MCFPQGQTSAPGLGLVCSLTLRRGKTGITGKSLKSFWRWILRTLQTLLTDKILETIETMNNRSVSQHNISSRMSELSELQSQRSDDAHIVAIRGCDINICHLSDDLNCTFSIMPLVNWHYHVPDADIYYSIFVSEFWFDTANIIVTIINKYLI